MRGLTLVRDRGRRIAAWLRELPPIAVLVTSWIFLILYAHPGQMTQDSYDLLIEARAGVYTDGHPPAVTVLWRIVDRVVAGPFGMLVLQSLALLAGLYLLLRRTFEPRRAAWLASALFAFPPIMLPMAVIWKDCLMAAFLMLGLAGLTSPRRAARVAGLVAMFAATTVRYNALAATLPLVVLLFTWTPVMHWLKRYAIATVAWLALTFAAFSVNSALTDKQMYLWHSSFAVFDIVGTLAFVDEDIPDAEVKLLFAGTEPRLDRDLHATARRLYSPREYLQIILGDGAMWHLPLFGHTPAPPARRAAIERAWRDVITRYPAAFLKHRLTVLGQVLWLTEPRPGAVPWRGVKYPEIAVGLGLGTHWSDLQVELTRYMKKLSWRTPIFTPWLYALLSLILLPLALRHRDVLAILLSGLALEGTLLLLAVSPDYRYSHWMVICTCVAVVILIARRSRVPRRVRPSDALPRSPSTA